MPSDNNSCNDLLSKVGTVVVRVDNVGVHLVHYNVTPVGQLINEGIGHIIQQSCADPVGMVGTIGDKSIGPQQRHDSCIIQLPAEGMNEKVVVDGANLMLMTTANGIKSDNNMTPIQGVDVPWQIASIIKGNGQHSMV